ncbi:MAG: hypothetical protein KQH83_10305 [Actinobacteria bacterium]|nr:hypothetical protein [Actinomycetota bacterium]
MRWRRTIVVALAGLLLVSGVGTAFAAEAAPAAADEAAAPDLDAVKARVLERIEDRIARFEATIAGLTGVPGVVAEQKVALAADGIEIFEEAAADVEAAGTIREVLKAYKSATREFKAHAKVRRLYTHVQVDIDTFTRRLARLDAAIDRADEAGYDVTGAVAESGAAAALLDEAQAMLDAVDPSQTGTEVMAALRAAHRTAHEGRRHVKAGLRALREAITQEA